MSLTHDQFLADVAAVYFGGSANGAFGSGRLIAPGLILTAGHVVDYPTRETPTATGWKACLLRNRNQNGSWAASPFEAKLIWRGPDDLDLALLQLSEDTQLKPAVESVFSSYNVVGQIAEVDAAGFPNAWFTAEGIIRDYTARGTLRIAAQGGPYAWSVPPADKPDDPHGWKGMSGAAVCRIGPDDKLYLFGTVQEVPANFSHGQLEVARFSKGFDYAEFRDHLRTALGAAPQVRDFYLGDSNAAANNREGIRNEIQAFLTSVEFAQLIARPAESDPTLQVLGRMGSMILSAPFLLVCLAYFQWFPELHGWWWWLPFVMLCAFPASIAGIILASFLLTIKYDKLAVGVTEKIYVIDATKANTKNGYFKVNFMTADNDIITIKLPIRSSLKVEVGDVGVAIFPHARQDRLVGFWRSKSFST